MQHGGTKGEQDKKILLFLLSLFCISYSSTKCHVLVENFVDDSYKYIGPRCCSEYQNFNDFIKYAIKTLFNGQIIIILRSNMLIGN
jgi:hypothetical protein